MSGPYKVYAGRLLAPTGACLATSPDNHWLETWRDFLNEAHAAGRQAKKQEVLTRLREETKEPCGGTPCPFLPNLILALEAQP